jgi:hypothetical protein
MLRDSSNQRLLIGLFQFHKKAVSTYTKANNRWDVLAALHLMVMLQLEDFSVFGKLSHICDSQMKFLEQSSIGQLTNHNLFGRVNKSLRGLSSIYFCPIGIQQLVPILDSICSISFYQEYSRRSQVSIEE